VDPYDFDRLSVAIADFVIVPTVFRAS